MVDIADLARTVAADFDLLRDPWIPVIDLDGTQDDLGLIDCLRRAHELREVADASPLVTFGIYRFLAAALQAYLPLRNEEAWADAWERGRFDDSLVERVEEACAGRLRVFGREHPFYQSADVPVPAPGARRPSEAKTVGYLFPEASTGTNVVHFAHAGDSAHAYCPACCARGLVSLAPFATSGGAGIRPSINGVPPVYVLPGGRNLFETLLLNHLLPRFQPHGASASDPGPLWTGDGVVPAKGERTAVGFVESLTWPPRRVRLFPGEPGRCSHCGRQSPSVVRQMIFAQGLSRPKDLPVWEDPWVGYHLRTDKEGGQVQRLAIRPQEGRDVWRDFAALFLAEEGKVTASQSSIGTRPAILQQIDFLLGEELLPTDTPLRFETFALRTDAKAKVFEWQERLFAFPAPLLHGRAAAAIETAIQDAEAAARCMAQSLRRLHPITARASADPAARRSALAATVTGATRRYWHELETTFHRMLGDERLLAGMREQQSWNEEWRQAARGAATRVFEATLEAGGFEADAAVLFRQEECRSAFYRGLAAALRPAAAGESGEDATWAEGAADSETDDAE